jgi:hypothetical protein
MNHGIPFYFVILNGGIIYMYMHICINIHHSKLIKSHIFTVKPGSETDNNLKN